jgi:hypothetical protein
MVQQRLVYCNPNGLAGPFTCFSTLKASKETDWSSPWPNRPINRD